MQLVPEDLISWKVLAEDGFICPEPVSVYSGVYMSVFECRARTRWVIQRVFLGLFLESRQDKITTQVFCSIYLIKGTKFVRTTFTFTTFEKILDAHFRVTLKCWPCLTLPTSSPKTLSLLLYTLCLIPLPESQKTIQLTINSENSIPSFAF